MPATLGDLVPTLGVIAVAVLITVVALVARRLLGDVISRVKINSIACCDRRDQGHLDATADRRAFDPSSLARARVHNAAAGAPRRRATDSAAHADPPREAKVSPYHTPERPFLWGNPRAFSAAALRWKREREQQHGWGDEILVRVRGTPDDSSSRG